MNREHLPSFPHPFINCVLLILGMVCGYHSTLLAQHKKLSRKEINVIRIDSVFKAAEQNSLNTKTVLRYEFYFEDPVEKRLLEFASRMAEDSFETASLLQKEKTWRLTLYKNARYSRETMYEQEHKMRGLKYNHYIDDYSGFSIHRADPDPLSVSEKEFNHYLYSLSDEDLFWVSRRLLDVHSFKRARVASELSVHRKYKIDTAAYYYGLALAETGDPDDAIDQWKMSLKVNPNYLDVFLSLGKLHYENGYFDKALEYYKKADAIYSNQSDILFKISETLYNLELYNQSFTYATRAHELDKKNVYLKSLLKMLKQPRIKYLRKKYPEK